MKLHTPALLALAIAGLSFSTQAQTAYPATLAGHALLPAQTLIPAPKDAPADLRVSGKFTTDRRVVSTFNERSFQGAESTFPRTRSVGQSRPAGVVPLDHGIRSRSAAGFRSRR